MKQFRILKGVTPVFGGYRGETFKNPESKLRVN